MIGRNKRAQPSDGLLKHRIFADDIEKLFRRASAAARPEARAASSGENDGVSLQFLFRHATEKNLTQRARRSQRPLRRQPAQAECFYHNFHQGFFGTPCATMAGKFSAMRSYSS